ncbi:hypothetical protein [Mycolicibacter sinensis]|uniref:hypothetical protein n=1 Tax=Mycolicibacter sinensis (strain JDM601) TaxID=875328 RepID=UPI001041ECFB|nr:hypothetical protein [Mycolicibacter sinensis]
MTDYDPFAGFDDNRELHQRLEQVASQSGQPAILDYDQIDRLADQIDQLAQTRNHDLRRLAAKTVDEYRWHLRNDGPLTGVTGPCVLLGFDPRVAFDMSEYTNEKLAAKYLARHNRCGVGAVHDRTIFAGKAEHAIKVVYGEYVCLYKACVDCLVWCNGLDDTPECLDFSLTKPVAASIYSTHVAT